MKLYKYKDFNEYKNIQERGNKKKLNKVFVNEKVIDVLSDYIKKNIKDASFGICHGTRRGIEQEYFIKKTGAKVIGTEISSTATRFPNTIQWDFHEIKDEWINNVDFIYTNAIDHSYDPRLALSQWLKCLKDDGVCFIEYTRYNRSFSKLDCFSANKKEMESLIKDIGVIHDRISMKVRYGNKGRHRTFIIFVVKKNK